MTGAFDALARAVGIGVTAADGVGLTLEVTFAALGDGPGDDDVRAAVARGLAVLCCASARAVADDPSKPTPAIAIPSLFEILIWLANQLSGATAPRHHP
jgi:hypothetical protein